MGKLNERELCTRAEAAYFKAAKKLGDSVVQPGKPQMIEHEGVHYVVLSNTKGTLAVYRVRMIDGVPILKGMKRWPSEVAPKV